MFCCGTTSPGEIPRCQAKPHPCHQRYHLSPPPAVKGEPPSTPTPCPSCSAPSSSPAQHLPHPLLTPCPIPCPISRDKARLSNHRLRVGREDSENCSRNKWPDKPRRLLVLGSKFTGLKLFTRSGPVLCPLWVTAALPARAKAEVGSVGWIPHQGRFPNERS